jgi:hypothetical protein
VTETIEDRLLEQTTWCEGWRKSPLWLRLLGGPKQFYDDRGSYRMRWGELSLNPCSVGLSVGGYETAHLQIALGLGQAFIRLPFLDRAICQGSNSIESPRFGFSIHATDAHLNWGRACKIINFPWQRRYLFCQFLGHDGVWRDREERARSWAPGEGVEPLKLEQPYHYMLDNGDVQHVTATVARERSWTVWTWFGESTHPRAAAHVKRRRAWVSDFLRSVQKRFGRPHNFIEVEFSAEVGSRAGSWKGGCIGCSHEMKPGETPRHTLQRMQRERRFR